MNDGDLKSVHYHLARLGGKLTGTSGRMPGGYSTVDYIDSCMTSEVPKWRQVYAFTVMTGWAALVGAGTVATIVFAYLADSVGGDSARRVAVVVCGGGLLFCAAGLMNAWWRALWFPSKAKWHARRHGIADERYGRAMRGILPRNSSLIWQGIAAVVLVIILV